MSEVSNAAPAAESSAPVEAQTSESNSGSEVSAQPAEGLNPEASSAEQKEQIKEDITKALKKKLKFKVDGQEIEEEIDFNDEEGLKKHLSLSKAAQKRMQEAANLQKDVKSFIEMLGKNPAEAMNKLGYNYEEMVMKFVEEKVQEMEKSPEQLEREKMQRELEELKAEKEKIAKEREESEKQRLQDQYAAKFEQDIDEAFTAGSYNIPKSPAVLKRIADTLLLAIDHGHKNVTVKDILPIVEKQYMADLHDMFGRTADDKLEKLMGEQTSERLRKQRLARAKAAKKTATANQIAQSTGEKSQPKEEAKAKRSADFFRNLK